MKFILSMIKRMESVSAMRFVRRLLVMIPFIKYCKVKRFNGVSTYPTRLFITGFFDNELINSVGVPVKHGDKQYALFIRPDIQNQFGEMRIFLAVLLGFYRTIKYYLYSDCSRLHRSSDS